MREERFKNKIEDPEPFEENREHWRYPPVPEEYIRIQAIEYVARQTNMSDIWVERMHDFQWKLVYDSLVDNKTVMVPRICRFLLKGNEFGVAIKKLEDEIKKLRKKWRGCDDSKEPRGKKNGYSPTKYKLKLQIMEKERRINDWKNLMEKQTQKKNGRSDKTDGGNTK